MPSPGEDIQSWSTVAANNGNSDPLINWAEGQTRASVNNSSRSEMAAIAKHRNLLNGSIVTTGTANAQAFLSGLNYTTTPVGLTVRLKVGPGLTNSQSMTLNMDGTGGFLVRRANGDYLLGGEFVANCYVDVMWDGSTWVFLYSEQFIRDQMTGGGGIIIGHQIFNTVGAATYTPTSGTECCIVECIGGGGGGGGAYTAGVNEYVFQGGGGGGGAYSRVLLTAAQLGASQTVTVGAGGLGGTAAGPGDGAAGGISSLGTFCVAEGGAGGTRAILGTNPMGGAGGTIATAAGDLRVAGTPGSSGMYGSVMPGQYTMAGNGAPGICGGGAVSQVNTAGVNATGYGAGGSGGSAYDGNTSGMAGGNGSPGIVIIIEFAGRGAPGRDGADGAPGPIGPTGPSGPGTGDVLRSGTPTTGQIARWTDASHIEGVASVGFINGIVLQKFTANGTYTPTPGMTYCNIEAVGGGGGGGGAGFSAGNLYAGGGGGAGGYSRSIKTAAEIGVSQAVTIGAGGTGGVFGASGADATDTSVGTLVIAKGGKGGAGATAVTFTVGGAGGAAGTGDIAGGGAPGWPGYHNATNQTIHTGGGPGGSSFFGGGAVGTPGDTVGIAAGNYGSGGSGGHAVSAARDGGNGSAGFVVITEYIAA